MCHSVILLFRGMFALRIKAKRQNYAARNGFILRFIRTYKWNAGQSFRQNRRIREAEKMQERRVELPLYFSSQNYLFFTQTSHISICFDAINRCQSDVYFPPITSPVAASI